MEQYEERKINLGYILCPNKYISQFFCISEKCVHCPIICSESKCDCLNIHRQCLRKQIKQFETSFSKVHSVAYNQHRECLYFIEKTYDELIENLSLKRQSFMNFTQTFGLGPKSIGLIKQTNPQIGIQIKKQQVMGSLSEIKQIQNNPIYATLDNVKKTKQKLGKTFQNICQELTRYQYHTFTSTLDSKILSVFSQNPTRRSGQQILRRFLGSKVKDFKLIFRASQHQFLAKAFHDCCDNTKNTIVLVETQFEKIIGGYNHVTWGGGQSLSVQYVQDLSNKCFLFSLSQNEKLELVNPFCAIQHFGQAGPMFGDEDLIIIDKCNQNQCSGNILKIYGKPAMRTQQIYKKFSGQTKGSKFLVKQYQVFQVIWQQK